MKNVLSCKSESKMTIMYVKKRKPRVLQHSGFSLSSAIFSIANQVSFLHTSVRIS